MSKETKKRLLRVLIVLSAPIWAPLALAGAILFLLLSCVVGFFEACVRYIVTGEFKSEIVDGL